MALLTAGCSNESDVFVSDDQSGQLSPVMVSVEGFSVSQGDLPAEVRATTRAQPVADYSSLKFLTLVFYKSDDTEAFKHTQVRDDATTYTTFGEFSTLLPLGSYTMVVIANGGNHAITLTSPTAATYGDAIPMDTWATTQAVNITGTEAVNLSATLDRIVAALSVRSTDNRPAEVTHTRITYGAGGKSFSPTSGLAISNTGFPNTIEYPASTIGTTTYVGGYLFLASDDQTMDVTIETLDAEGAVLFTKTVENVPLKRNRQTRLTGTLYTADVVASGFQVNTDWLTIHDMDF